MIAQKTIAIRVSYVLHVRRHQLKGYEKPALRNVSEEVRLSTTAPSSHTKAQLISSRAGSFPSRRSYPFDDDNNNTYEIDFFLAPIIL